MTRHRLLLTLGAQLIIASAMAAQELVTLTTPEVKPTNTSYQISQLSLNWEDKVIVLIVKGQNGEEKECRWNDDTTPTGATLMRGLNKANLAIRSLTQRAFDQAIAIGCLAGTVGGTVP